MLFLVNDDGVPSIAKFVQMEQTTVVWVDFDFNFIFEFGTFGLPFDTLAEGIAAVPPGGVIRIKSGSSDMETPVIIGKPMVIESFDGSAVVE